MVRLAVWQTALGGVVFGALPADPEWYGDNDALYPLGALLGAGLGASTAIVGARALDFRGPEATTVIAAQQLGLFNGGMLLSDLGDYDGETLSFGLLVGAGAGTAAGWALASRHPDPAVPVAIQSGAWWGLGLALAGMSYTYAWEDWEFDPTTPLLLAVNGGALGGYALARFAHLSRSQIRAANIGALFAAGSTYYFAYFTSDVIWYTEDQVVAIVALSGVAGGVAGAILAGRMDASSGGVALVHGRDGALAAGLPLPTPRPTPQGMAWDVTLVDWRF
jgi:hypothetical protein